ncbi:MAG: SRPBCC family protein [Pseudonocardia sp.]
MSDKKIQVTGTVAATPEQVFALLADPARHTELDGAGMLRGLESGPSPVTGTGDAFVMNMHQDAFGGYQMRSEITAFEPNRKIAWAPDIHPKGALSAHIGDLDPCGQQYIWELEPDADGGTRITHTYDWSGLRDKSAEGIYPIVSAEAMRRTIERLGEAAG